MGGIYISYRRSDSRAAVGRLVDDLGGRFGADQVLIDVDIPVGEDFLAGVQAQLRQADVMLVVIGARWLDLDDGAGRPRLFQADDFVRIEIAAALRSDMRVVPVLVDGADLPLADDLPPDLQPLVRRQAMALRLHRWDSDVGQLAAHLQTTLGGRAAMPARAPASPLKDWLRRQLGAPPAAEPPPPSPRQARPRPPVSAPPPSSKPAPEPAPTAAPTAPTAPTSASPAVTPAHSVFVSHSSQDRPQVEQVVAALEAAGHRCWVSYRDLPEGDPAWSASIMAALRTSQAVVVVLTPQSNQSRHVLREVTVADEKRIACLPLKTRPVTLDESLAYFFTTTQQLDATAMPWAEAMERLVGAVRRALPAP